MLRSDFLRHGAIVFGATMFSNMLGYVFHVFMSRVLGVTAYGDLSSLMAVLALCTIPSSIITMVVVKYAAELHALGDNARLRRLSQNLTLWLCVVAAALPIVGGLFQTQVARYLQLPNSSMVLAASFALAGLFVLPGLRGVLQGVQDFGRLAILTVLEGAGKTVFGVGFALLGSGVAGAVAGFGVASFTAIVYALFAVRSHFHVPPIRLRLNLRRLIVTSSGIAVAMLANNTLTYSDVVFVKHFFTPHDAGIYSATSLVGKVFLFVVGFVPTLVLPKATAKAANGESPNGVLMQALVLTGAICAIGLTILAVSPVRVVQFFVGAKFNDAAQYVLPYALAMSLLGGTLIASSYKIALHRFDFVIPLAVVTVAEIVAIQFFHSTIWDVIHIILACSGIAFALTLYRITAKVEPAHHVAEIKAAS